MKKVLLPALLACGLPLTASAQNALEGTWRIDWSLTFPDVLDKFELHDGYYDCQTCAPALRVKADGKDHPVRGYPGFDTLAVEIKNDYQISTRKKKAGKLVETLVMSVSADGKLLRYNSYSGADQADVEGAERTRLGEPVKGEHAISGIWITPGMREAEADSTSRYHFDNGRLKAYMGSSESFDAPLDGTLVPYVGSREIDKVAVRQLAERVLNIQLYQGERFVREMQVSATEDGRALSIYFVTPSMSGNLVARKVTGS
ncbi:hypothetical protein ACLUTX_16130 [Enterobacterales bacterium AE_CKDN230030158-1A_HGKHYDSX7]